MRSKSNDKSVEIHIQLDQKKIGKKRLGRRGHQNAE